MRRTKSNSVNSSTLSTSDVAQIGLQRTSGLLRLPGLGRLSVTAWEHGFGGLLLAEALFRRNHILYKALDEIRREFEEIVSYLSAMEIKRIVDIGCGHALIEPYFFQRFCCDIHLVDIEKSSNRHHGFRKTGAGYSSLRSAVTYLENNGVEPRNIRATNPQKTLLSDQNVDLIISLLSCGFHYPLSEYLPFVKSSLRPGGAFVFDLRREGEDQANLSQFSEVNEVHATVKYRRLLCRL